MNDYIKIIESEDNTDVVFYIENEKVMSIGESLEEINENAYMNGYNWEALLNCYIMNYVPELEDTFETDPEAGMYAAYFGVSDEDKANAKLLADTIVSLVENKEKLFDFVREYGDEIEWD